MTKKTFVRKARVVRGSRWYIDFTTFHTATGEESRQRIDFQLNNIENVEIRALVAERIADALEHFVIEVGSESKQEEKKVRLCEVFPQVVAEKIAGFVDRPNSSSHFRTCKKYFPEFAQEVGVWRKPLADFSKKHTRKWKNWLREKGFAGRTINNYTDALVTLWEEMVADELILANPWAKIKPEKVGKKRRRQYTADEARLVMERLRQENYLLFLAAMLIYYCTFRVEELCRLRRRDFDLSTGLICVTPEVSKSWKDGFKTIPAVALRFFQDSRFSKISDKCFWLGEKWNPNPEKALTTDTLHECLRRILTKMESEGVISDTKDLTLYSWKDTGITKHIKLTSPLATRDQAMHSDLGQTMLYYKPPVVNVEYRDLPDTIGLK